MVGLQCFNCCKDSKFSVWQAYDCSAIEADGKSATLKSEMVAPVLNDSITKLFSQSYKGEEPAKDES